jgi:hypothetical protein
MSLPQKSFAEMVSDRLSIARKLGRPIDSLVEATLLLKELEKCRREFKKEMIEASVFLEGALYWVAAEAKKAADDLHLMPIESLATLVLSEEGITAKQAVSE